jgi:hypothetical protein
VIYRELWCRYRMLTPDGSRCALSWLLYARGGKTIGECESTDEYRAQGPRLFPDVESALLANSFGAGSTADRGSDWTAAIIDANNRLHGAARDARLRKLFALAGLTLEIRSVPSDLSALQSTSLVKGSAAEVAR